MRVNKELEEFIKSIPIFSNCKPETISNITNNIHIKKLFKNETPYLEGDNVDSIYIVKNGRLEICKISEEGKKITMKMVEKGDIFCLSNIFSTKAINTCISKKDSILYAIRSNVLKKFCELDKNLSSSVMINLIKNITEYSRLIERVKLMDGEACISSLLLSIQKNHKINATQEELADMSGLCRETVSRLLKILKSKGCVETSRGEIIIKNLNQLSRLCN